MKIRSGFVSNSSASSFIVYHSSNDVMWLACSRKDPDIVEAWTKEDIFNWIVSMYKREYKREKKKECTISDSFFEKYLKVYNLEEAIKEKDLDLSYWYAGYQLSFPEDKWLIYAEDGILSEELKKKICKKFKIHYMHGHMG